MSPDSPFSFPPLGPGEPLKIFFSQQGFESCVSTAFNTGDMVDLDLQAVGAHHRSSQCSIHTRHTPHLQTAAHKKELHLVIHEGKYSSTLTTLPDTIDRVNESRSLGFKELFVKKPTDEGKRCALSYS